MQNNRWEFCSFSKTTLKVLYQESSNSLCVSAEAIGDSWFSQSRAGGHAKRDEEEGNMHSVIHWGFYLVPNLKLGTFQFLCGPCFLSYISSFQLLKTVRLSHDLSHLIYFVLDHWAYDF